VSPFDERSRIALADVLLASGDVAGARQALLDTLQTIPDATQAHWKLGRLYQTVGDEQGALRSFEAAAERPPIAGAGHLLASIAQLHHNKLDLDSASAVYARRVRVTPNDSAAHIDLGEVLRAQDRLGDALREFFVAALIEPTSARAFAAIGQLQVSQGRDDDGERMLRKAVALDPAHIEAHYALSRALLRLGRRDEAEQELSVFRQLQSKAMDDERRRFKDNQLKIEEALRVGDQKEPAR
jgi:tetratricopeptide (TPR) repeat protein